MSRLEIQHSIPRFSSAEQMVSADSRSLAAKLMKASAAMRLFPPVGVETRATHGGPSHERGDGG